MTIAVSESQKTESCKDEVDNAASGSAGPDKLANLPMPKHIPFPEFTTLSEFFNELIMFAFVAGSTLLQFVNIFGTGSWWIPESTISHAVNVHLMDPYLVGLIVAMTGRRFLYCVAISLLNAYSRSIDQKRLKLRRLVLKYSYALVLCSLLGYCFFKIYMVHNYSKLLLLLYPIFVYLPIFGLRIEPFLRLSFELEDLYFNDMPMHSCSSQPVAIRDEIAMLKSDFNNRMKQVLFTSLVNAYYGGLVPCFFAPTVVYSVPWTSYHIIYFWLGGLTLNIAFVFPSKYSDILHRAALHLGSWLKLDWATWSVKLISNTAVSWSKQTSYARDIIVKDKANIYLAMGRTITVAEPGNGSHARFYKLFYNPSMIYMVLTILQTLMILSQIISLYFVVEWNFVLAITFVGLANQFTLFKLMRDYLISKSIYKSETSISDYNKPIIASTDDTPTRTAE